MELALLKKSGGIRFWGELASGLRKTPGELALITPVKGGGVINYNSAVYKGYFKLRVFRQGVEIC